MSPQLPATHPVRSTSVEVCASGRSAPVEHTGNATDRSVPAILRVDLARDAVDAVLIQPPSLTALEVLRVGRSMGAASSPHPQNTRTTEGDLEQVANGAGGRTAAPFRLSGSVAETLPGLVRAVEGSSSASPVRLGRIVIGLERDPAASLSELFEALTVCSDAYSGPITLQTRSPLVLLTVPLLRRPGSRLTVRMHVETIDERIARAVTPEAGRPAERLSAAAALHRAGIPAVLRAHPLVVESSRQSVVLLKLARALLSTGCPVEVGAPAEVFAPAVKAEGEGPVTQFPWSHTAHHRLVQSLAETRSALGTQAA